jgi:Flp pilus assembly secretin CpaC
MALSLGSWAGEAPAGPEAGTPPVAAIQELLKGIPSVRVTQAGSSVVIDGSVSTLLAKERVERLVSSFKGVVSLVTLDESTESNEILAKEILAKIGLVGLSVKMVRGHVVLEGEVANESDRKSAEAVAKTFSEKIVNNIGLKDQMIEVDVAFVDMRLDRTLNLHHNPLEALDRVTISAGSGGNTLGGSHQYKPNVINPTTAAWSLSAETSWVFRFIESDNDNKILDRPHLTTLSRQPATFQQGGERGYEVTGVGSSNVVFKPYGILLNVTPELTKDGKVRCLMSFEVSTPEEGGNRLDFVTYKTSATALLEQGQSLIVSGLVQDIQARLKRGTPWLMRIPLLGHFFTSHDDTNTKRDLLLVITPRLPLVLDAKATDTFAKEQNERINPVPLRWVEQLNSDLLPQPTPEDKLRMKEKDRQQKAPAPAPAKPAAKVGEAEQPWLPLEPATAAANSESQAEPKAEVTNVNPPQPAKD